MKHFRVTIQDELSSRSPLEALVETVERIKNEETAASVECLTTGEVFHFEISTGKRLDFEEQDNDARVH